MLIEQLKIDLFSLICVYIQTGVVTREITFVDKRNQQKSQNIPAAQAKQAQVNIAPGANSLITHNLHL